MGAGLDDLTAALFPRGLAAGQPAWEHGLIAVLPTDALHTWNMVKMRVASYHSQFVLLG